MAGPKKVASQFVRTGERLTQDSQSLARKTTDAFNRCPFLYGRLVSVSLTAGIPQIVTHKLGTVARCFQASLAYGNPLGVDDPVGFKSLWIERYWRGPSLANIVNAAGSNTVGCRFQVARRCVVIGIRFLWRTDAAARTIRCKLWNDSSGALLASADATSVNRSGMYHVYFTRPIDLATLVATDLVVSIWETSGTKYIATNASDVLQTTFVDWNLPTDTVILRSLKLFSAGDARPTSNAAAENYMVEPILMPEGIKVAEDIDQTKIDIKNQMRVIADATGTVDLWFYPKASKQIPTGTTQSP